MTPRQVLDKWVDAFNRADADALADLYSIGAINHQVANTPVEGREEIRKMFQEEFGRASMECIVDNVFEDGDWVIMEWKDPNGLRGSGFFHVRNDKIIFQRGYWDKLSFLKLHGLPVK